MGSILLTAYALITVCREAPQTIMDMALYEMKYYNYIIIKQNNSEDRSYDNN